MFLFCFYAAATINNCHLKKKKNANLDCKRVRDLSEQLPADVVLFPDSLRIVGVDASVLGYNSSTCGCIGWGPVVSIGLVGYTSLSLNFVGDVKEKIGVDILFGEYKKRVLFGEMS